ncbi:MAG: ammonium transporter, partial [Candidatus Cloacimonetes bacterium]|nr:ammonium transporter [Candidatus Cloacimonadota bacterium]
TCKRNILGIMIQSFVSLGVSTILWYAIGYSLCFSGSGPIIGNFDKAFLIGVNSLSPFGEGLIPEFVFFAYQMMFAIITPALITGAFTGRVSFKAYLIFLVAWQLFVYYPFVHMLWGDGILAEWGVRDFAGGIVVHVTAGFAALASVIFVGERKNKNSKPNSVPLVAVGTGLLWFGWYGFNAGSELQVDNITVQAFVNTDIAASFAAITWLFIEWRKEKKPKFVGLMTGAVAGLATITPAAGFVPVWAAAIIGIASGIGCYYAVALKNKLNWDDALDVWGVHGVGNFIGTMLLGVFATLSLNPAGGEGLITGNTSFFLKQLLTAIVAASYAFIFTYAMLWGINKITVVRVHDEHESTGLDKALHDEDAYT